MPGNTLKLSGKVREKSGNFILPNLWEPCKIQTVIPYTALIYFDTFITEIISRSRCSVMQQPFCFIVSHTFYVFL